MRIRIEGFLESTDKMPGYVAVRHLLLLGVDLCSQYRLRQRNNGHPTTTQQFASVRQRTYGAVAFLSWLAALELTLGSCRQADLDRWPTDDAVTHRDPAGHFIRWATTTG